MNERFQKKKKIAKTKKLKNERLEGLIKTISSLFLLIFNKIKAAKTLKYSKFSLFYKKLLR